MEKDKILIVDDEDEIRRQLRWALSGDYEVIEASGKAKAIDLIREKKPQLLTLDICLDASLADTQEGMNILVEALNIDPKLKVIMITGNNNRELALRAIKLGAYDYYEKPINLEEIKVILKRALCIQKLERENERLTQELGERHKFENIIGSCPGMRDVFNIIRRVSPTDVTVLINGESGTGKELAARAVHYCSPRKDEPLGVINCGAIPENLLESELFGHERGSFTDAYTKKIGKLEMANKGTVFLDEIGEMSLGLQVKMLRFLQERTIERVGSSEHIVLDVRIVAATNSDLKKKILEGTFREDLYYRLSVVTILLPPLREREEDILLLAEYYLNRFAQENNKPVRGFNREAAKAMSEYSWPGNIRELENKIKRAVILANHSQIVPEDLGLRLNKENQIKSLKKAREELDIKFIQEALVKSKGSVSEAAKEIGISRVSFYDLIRKYKIAVEKTYSL
ncbi:MAG: PEP-CTERM-box response regulator transcription factor [Candidatus Omnitrophota bacterium]